jgi:hypothetical protein
MLKNLQTLQVYLLRLIAPRVPLKQIVIAAGDGSKATLGTFDYLIRLPQGENVTEAVTA